MTMKWLASSPSRLADRFAAVLTGLFAQCDKNLSLLQVRLEIAEERQKQAKKRQKYMPKNVTLR